MTVWKFPLPMTNVAEVSMPTGARILYVGIQAGEPFLWAAVDPNAEAERRRVRVAGTGHGLGDVGAYIGSFMMAGGALVFHVFEMPR